MQRLHLCAYPCERCGGPVVAASIGTRESEIRRESVRRLGAVCIVCGNRQDAVTEPVVQFLPHEWVTNIRQKHEAGIAGQKAAELSNQPANGRQATASDDFRPLVLSPALTDSQPDQRS